jgi:ribosomal protein S18 acetylase RimI-like enzyme
MVEHSIVPGRPPEDTEDFVKLFVISGPEFVPALFAGTHERVAAGCFRHKHNLLASEHTHFVKVNGENAGMILAYAWLVKRQQAAKSSFLTVRYMRTKFFTRMRPLQWSDAVLSKLDEGTFYVSNVAFYSESRNQGLGTSLLAHTEESARKSGARRLDVDAETDNEGALRFYQRFGMNTVGGPKRIVINGKEFEFIRLTKAISPIP